MMCSTEDCKGILFARGLCQACYTRLRRNGTIERRYVKNSGVCSKSDCGLPSFSKNLCKKHYDRQRHPLSVVWRLLRSRNAGAYPPEWNRFEVFIATVGDRPSDKHQLRRKNATLPWSLTNWEWLEPIVVPDRYSPGQRSIYERSWRFKKRYGITVEDYDRMLAEQGGLCATCRRPSTQVHAKSGKLRDLAVDHDHKTNAVRGLLCTDCNVVLGLVEDNPDRLRVLIDYLERHQSPRVVPGMTLLATLPDGLGNVTALRFQDGALVSAE